MGDEFVLHRVQAANRKPSANAPNFHFRPRSFELTAFLFAAVIRAVTTQSSVTVRFPRGYFYTPDHIFNMLKTDAEKNAIFYRTYKRQTTAQVFESFAVVCQKKEISCYEHSDFSNSHNMYLTKLHIKIPA